MNDAMGGVVNVMTAIVGVAALAVIFSPKAQTGRVIRETGKAFADSIGAANAPVRDTGLGSVGGFGGLFELPQFGSM